MINDDDDNYECETRAAVWIEARNVKCRAEEVPPDQLTFGSGLLLGARWISRSALLAPVARSWQGGRRSG